MDTLPSELILSQLLPLLHASALYSTSQSCSRFRGLAAKLVHTIRLLDKGAIKTALASNNLLGFSACQTLSFLHDEEDARLLCPLLSRVTRHWPLLCTLVLQRTLALHGSTAPLDLLAPLCILAPHGLSRLEIMFDIKADHAVLDTLGSMTQLTALQLQLAGGPHDLAPLGRLAQLQQLHLRACVDDDSEAWLPSSLQALTLCRPGPGDLGLSWVRAVRACTQLRSLTLEDLEDEDMVLDLTSCARLTRLDGCINTPFLDAINLPPSLQLLQLSCTMGMREGVYRGWPACRIEDFAQHLSACTNLEVLELQCVRSALPALPKLRSVCLQFGSAFENLVDAVYVPSVLASLPSTVTCLELVSTFDNISSHHLTSCTGLRELCLNAEYGNFTLDFQHLRPLTALTKLVLCNEAVNGQIVDSLHEEELHLLPLQQLFVAAHNEDHMRGLVGARCQVMV